MALVKVKSNPSKPPVKMNDQRARDWVSRFPDQYELVEPMTVIKQVKEPIPKVKRPETVQKPVEVKKKVAVVENKQSEYQPSLNKQKTGKSKK